MKEFFSHETAVVDDGAQIGKGTKMTLFFPRFMDEELSIAQPKKSEIPAKMKILLIDDEEIIREVGKRMLIKGGYEVQVANNGMEALELYRKDPEEFDLVLLDLIMPEMDGKEIFHRLKEINPDAWHEIVAEFLLTRDITGEDQ